MVRGYATPVVWEVKGKKQAVLAGTLRVIGYDLETGKELRTVRGLSRVVTPTPVIGPDNVLYLAGWSAGGDDADRFTIEPFATIIEEWDKNKNGTLEFAEVPKESPFSQRFVQIDRDKDEHISKDEYETMRRIFDTGKNVLVAIKPGGQGDVTNTHVLWEQRRYLPFVPSPLYYKGSLFSVKNGGIVTSLDTRTGEPITNERVPGPGDYYASPVAGDGKVYLANQRGDVCVISGEGEWKLLNRARMGEDIFATPAIVDGRIYLRTSGHLYCFGLANSK
jgi:outer membrane protein assembly factor BamB